MLLLTGTFTHANPYTHMRTHKHTFFFSFPAITYHVSSIRLDDALAITVALEMNDVQYCRKQK